MKFTIASAALVVVGIFFMDTPERKVNRLDIRNSPEQAFLINHLNSPMPWERN